MGNVVVFPSRRPVVFVDPCDVDGGSWGVYRQQPGHAATMVTSRFALHEAEATARSIAAEIGGEYLNDAPPEPLGAA